MTRTVEYVDIDLEALLEDGSSKQCNIMTGFAIGALRRGWRCPNPAVVQLLVRCPEHGPRREPTCQQHLRLARALRWVKGVRCWKCNRRPRWIDS